MTKINRLTLAVLALAIAGCNPFPAAITPDESPAVVYEVAADGELSTVAARPGEWATVTVEGAVIRFRVAGAAGKAIAPGLTGIYPDCPCPTFATQDHPEDPNEAPGEWCLAKSRTGLWIPASEHPACQREARERKGQAP